MARRITIGTTAALALAALIVAILALIDDPAPAPAPAAAPPPSKAEPSAYTHWFMQQALARYDAQGRQAALAFSTPPTVSTASGTSSSSRMASRSAIPTRTCWAKTCAATSASIRPATASAT